MKENLPNASARAAISALAACWMLAPFAASPAAAQNRVTVAVPAEAILVSRAQTRSGDSAFYRVPGGGKLTLEADGCKVLVEKGGTVTVNGSDNEIYVDSGRGDSVVGGEDNRVFLTFRSPTLNIGKNNRLQPVAGIDVVREEASAIAAPVVATAPPAVTAPAVPPAAPAAPIAPVAPPPKERRVGGEIPPDPPVASTPWIAELLKLLPASSDSIPGNPAPGVSTGEFEGQWKIVGLVPASDKMGGVGPDASGSVVFEASGAGRMQILIDVLGQEIKRDGYFLWKADQEKMTINEGTPKASVWRRSEMVGDRQGMTLSGRGPVDFTLRLERVKEGL